MRSPLASFGAPVTRLSPFLAASLLLLACSPGGDGSSHLTSSDAQTNGSSSSSGGVGGSAGGAPSSSSTVKTTFAPAKGTPSKHAGMGALVYDGGVAFRVWAPDATRVWVHGDFNTSEDPGTELSSEGNGNFSLDVDGAGAGQEYEFVITDGTNTVHRADPRSRQVIDNAGTFGNSVIVDPNSYTWTNNFTTPPFNKQVIYELHVGTFDGSAGVGTWKSAESKLPYLAGLGVNMIEVLPVTEFPGDYSWGYNPSFPFATESSYGSPDDLKHFIDQAHGAGIGVIIDTVHNHYGPDLGRSLWCFDITSFNAGGIYFYSDWRKETGFGPRPDYGRQAVRDYIVDTERQWLEEFRADGLRWDSTVNIRQARNGSGQMVDIDQGWPLLQRITDTSHASQPWKIQIAEDLQQNSAVTSSTGGGGAGFDSQWETEFFYPMKDALLAIDDSSRDMNRVAYAIAHNYGGQATQRITFTENHDQVAPQNGGQRLSESICPGLANGCRFYAEKRTTLGAAVLMTAPGVPMIFQGQEFVDNTPFPFGKAVGVDWSKQASYSGIVQLYTDLIHMRTNAGGATAGLAGNNVNVFHVNNGGKVVAYHRWDKGGAGDDTVVVANFSNVAFPTYTIGFPRGGTWHVRFNSDSSDYSADFANTASSDMTAAGGGKDGLSYSGNVGIGAYSVIVLSQ